MKILFTSKGIYYNCAVCNCETNNTLQKAFYVLCLNISGAYIWSDIDHYKCTYQVRIEIGMS